MAFGTVEQAIRDLREGKFVVVADDESRENEGDLICAAELVTPDMVNVMLRAKGMICVALEPERVARASLSRNRSLAPVTAIAAVASSGMKAALRNKALAASRFLNFRAWDRA